ncbi:LacI family DNA-binding transcriptional regulator [Franconibacter helveticus]|uniref:LacI family DNA-binding transcriptional regulator n=1 Tax=Franconibacter helveticus TaxID=357240 RepID=UPI0023AA1DC8|nr:LacI family DNA-binding transcriptional regulator [Franconibacter helveticus]
MAFLARPAAMKPKAITLYDVARHAGVSYQTVSRVINQAEHVSQRTRERVEQAMAQLHYVPNRVAQQLAGKPTMTLGLVTATLALHAPSQIAAAMKIRASERGFSVVISMLDENLPEACHAAVESLLAQRVDGVLVNVPLEDEDARQLAQRCHPLPVLFLDVGPQAPVSGLVFDAAQGARLAVEHMLSLGHRRIALLAGPQNAVSARLRYEGWREALSRAALEPCAVAHGDWSAACGYQQCHVLLAAQPEAIIVANDQMALGALRACAERGINVPEALSIMGYDDTADSAWYSPPLTTIRQDFRELGEQAVDRLVADLTQPLADEQQMLPVSLVERRTIAPRQQAPDAQRLAQALRQLAQDVARLKNP